MPLSQYVKSIPRSLKSLPGKQTSEDHLLQDNLITDQAKLSLLDALYGDLTNSLYAPDPKSPYLVFYFEFLKSRLEKLPYRLGEVVTKVGNQTAFDFNKFLEVAASICQLVSKEPCCSLETIVTDLADKGLVTSDDVAKVQQLVFSIFGIISTLYMPSKRWVPDTFTVDVPLNNANRRRASDTWLTSTQPIGETNGTLVNILRNFGTARGPIFIQEEPQTPFDELNMLSVPNLQYYTLSKLGGIKLQWVKSVSQHLELNRRDKTLMVFRYPSICALLAQQSARANFLDTFFKDYIEESGKSTTKRAPAVDFYREVLLTYRVLFGQDKKSWRLCKSEGQVPKATDTYNALDNPDPGYDDPNDDPNDDGIDPLLCRLCCHDWEQETVYDEIQAPDARSVYSARHDFPFMGERLIALQEFTRLLEPTGWRTLYYDRRDLNRFATIWAAIFFGATTLLLAVLALGLAAAQVAGSF